MKLIHGSEIIDADALASLSQAREARLDASEQPWRSVVPRGGGLVAHFITSSEFKNDRS
jgi:hypothetical protein